MSKELLCTYGFLHTTPWTEPHWHVNKCKQHDKYFCMPCLAIVKPLNEVLRTRGAQRPRATATKEEHEL